MFGIQKIRFQIIVYKTDIDKHTSQRQSKYIKGKGKQVYRTILTAIFPPSNFDSIITSSYQ